MKVGHASVANQRTVKLTSAELVLFFCTFLALRSHDNGTNPIKRIIDDELRGEKSIMAGYGPSLSSFSCFSCSWDKGNHRRRVRTSAPITQRSGHWSDTATSIRSQEGTKEVRPHPDTMSYG